MEAHGACDCDTLVNPVDLPCAENLRFTPHPISADPRIEQGHQHEHEHDLENVHLFAARILQPGADMIATNEDDAFPTVGMKCCCGRADCVYLEHNNAALGGLERDLETAARLGQALLLRHECYINESQAEQARLSTYVSELEAERLSLRSANEKMVAENRDLLQRLEYLNGNLADSDQEVKRLEDLLSNCESEVKRLNNLARRTEELDDQVREMEQERQLLNKQMEDGWEESRSTLARWRESDRKVRELEEEVRRIEWEAQLDREQHEQIVAKLARERTFERELGGAEGRLKGATAVQNLSKDTSGAKNVVSHFVKDILQDNANLQAGIEELRQLLHSSNEEVQSLRQQIVLHQPVPDNEYETDHRSVSLDQELQIERTSPMQHQREVHVHHHYHAKPIKSRATSTRKPTRRRIGMPGHGSISDSSAPPTPMVKAKRYNSGPIAPLNLTHVQKNRWSIQSTATMSSVLSSIPSSPARSYFDRGGIFDRIERGEESSRPTSPESMADLLSPGPGQWIFQSDKEPLPECEEEEIEKPTFDMSPLVESKPVFDANELPTPTDSESPEVDKDSAPSESTTSEADKEVTPKPSIILQSSTHEADGTTTGTTKPRPPDKTSSPSKIATVGRDVSHAIFHDLHDFRPSITRKGSHETLVSISGMDIHIPQRAPPAATLELLHSHFAHRPAQTRKVSAVQPVTEVTEYTATSTPACARLSHSRTISQQIPSSIEALSGIAIPKTRMARTTSQTGAIGRLGGWVRGRLGVAQVKSSDDIRPSPSSRTASIHSARSAETPSVRHDSTVSRTNSSASSMMVDAIESESSKTGTASGSISVPSHSQPNPLHAKVDPMILFAGRSPGVNQPGFIPGFRAAVMNRRTPSQVMTSVIDEEGLMESLAE